MALFNRRNKTEVPEEIQEYYQTERRERAGIAWLLAFGTLIITIVLAAGIFFAGRWAYRKIAGTDNDNGTTQVTQNEGQQQDQQQEPPAETPDQKTEDERKAEEERQRQEEEARRVEEERQQAAQTEQERETAQSGDEQVDGVNDQRQVAVTGDIPDTGPGDTAAVFFAVSILGYVSHRLYSRKTAK